MNMKKIYLGRTRSDFELLPDEKVWLSKHEWDCGWYWGMGYIGNKNLHTHFDSTFLHCAKYTPKEIFKDTKITEKEWWIIRDLFIQAYALKATAAIYRHGGHQTTVNGVTNIILNKELEDKLNADCKIVLDKIWSILEEVDNR